MGAAGMVTEPEEPGLSARAWTSNGRYGLSMSRSIGDHLLAKHGVIATPEARDCAPEPHIALTHAPSPNPWQVESHTVVAGDEFMILATDGIWEFISSAEAVAIVAKYKNATEACYHLIHEATDLWRKEEGDYRDDITALVIMLQPLRDCMKPSPQTPADLLSPTSKELRLKKKTMFRDQSREAVGSPLSPGSTASPLASPGGSPHKGGIKGIEKAKSFRKRRLSTTPMAGDLIAEANRKHEEQIAARQREAATGGGERGPELPNETGGEPSPPKERKRRLSISPDMDQTGKSLVPKGMGP